MQVKLILPDIDRRKTLEKEKEKQKIRKSQKATIFFFTFSFCIEKYIF